LHSSHAPAGLAARSRLLTARSFQAHHRSRATIVITAAKGGAARGSHTPAATTTRAKAPKMVADRTAAKRAESRNRGGSRHSTALASSAMRPRPPASSSHVLAHSTACRTGAQVQVARSRALSPQRRTTSELAADHVPVIASTLPDR
jgi:hypothetical protein